LGLSKQNDRFWDGSGQKKEHRVATQTGIKCGTTGAFERTPFVLWAIILFLFVSIGRIQEIIPGLEKLYPGKVFGILMLGAYFFSSKKNRVSFKEFKEVVCVLGIFLLSLLSIPLSVWPTKSAESAISFFLNNCLLLYIIANSLTSYNQTRKLVFAFLAATALLSASALAAQGGALRISSGVTYDPNDLAFLLVCAFPFAAFGFFEEKGIKKILLLLDIGLMIVTVIFTRSRGGFLGLIFVGGFIILKTFKKRRLIAGLLLAGSVGAFVLFSPPDYWERMSTIVEPGDDYNVTSSAGRIEIWKRGIKIMIENPLTGVGIGNFATAQGLSHKNVPGAWLTAHNSFIQIGGELGFGGVILFCLLLYYLFRRIRRFSFENHKFSVFKNSIEVSLVGYMVGGFFLSQAYNVVLYLIVGLTVALSCFVKRSGLNHV
jgi:O-antigen ligase